MAVFRRGRRRSAGALDTLWTLSEILASRLTATASMSLSNKSAYIRRVTLGSLWPSIRDTARTFAPELTARLAHVCRKSGGVIVCTRARSTALLNHPVESYLGRFR